MGSPPNEPRFDRRSFLRTSVALSGLVGISGCTGPLEDFDGTGIDLLGRSEPWAMSGGTPGNTRTVPGSAGPSEPIDLAWRFDLPAHRARPMAATDETVIVAAGDTTVHAVDARTGDERWRFDRSQLDVLPTAIADGRLFVGTVGGGTNLYAIDVMTGAERWKVEVPVDGAIGPAVSGDTVIVASRPPAGTVVGLDIATGEVRWRYEEPSDGTFEPVVLEGNVYIGSRDTTVYCVDADTGEESWRFTGARHPTSPPAVLEDLVVFGTSRGSVFALDRATGRDVWRFTDPLRAVGIPAALDDAVYFTIPGARSVYALEAATGEQRWHFLADGSFETANWPAVTEDSIYFGGESRRVYAVDTASGEERWRIEVGEGVMSYSLIIDDTLYVGSEDGESSLFAFR